VPIPDDNYVKTYQRNPELWPVQFFVVAHRRVVRQNSNNKSETQILARKSANGTSQWGLGTGVPATQWVLSSSHPPAGYQWSTPRITIEASDFPEFSKAAPLESWTYRKIDICEDAFNGPDATELRLTDPELETYTKQIRNELRTELELLHQETMSDGNFDDQHSSWEAIRVSVVKHVVANANSLAAIQGTLRMSGLFAPLGSNTPDPAEIVQSMRIFTMWPQMPDPMPLPSTPSDALQNEIATRDLRMADTGRDPHKDRYGRIFTHKSTSNVSNTIHGVYFSLDLTNLPGLDDDVPAFDLFGTKEIQREWKSLEDLKVLDTDGESISTEDTKPTFISGFIVRQLVKDGVIEIRE
jgi:hypothetical protein